MRLFMGQGINPILTIYVAAPNIAAVGTIFNVFGYDTVSSWDSNLSPAWSRVA